MDSDLRWLWQSILILPLPPLLWAAWHFRYDWPADATPPIVFAVLAALYALSLPLSFIVVGAAVLVLAGVVRLFAALIDDHRSVRAARRGAPAEQRLGPLDGQRPVGEQLAERDTLDFI